ncbi:MAG TPA: aldo/keto reductase [Stellaceae bacterium]|nr:aldo/keto reductase [Stellaceae bacterium]
METRALGKNGPQVSVIGLGCNNFGGRLDLAGTREVVAKAIDVGINFFDTADIYGGRTYNNYGGSEVDLGAALGSRRKDIVLATKFGMVMEGGGSGAKRAYVMSACEASLKRLKTDYIDLYQIHTPDTSTPIEETLRALDDLVKQGKVRHIGCSNFSAKQIDEAMKVSHQNKLAAFVSSQDEYSLLVRDEEQATVPVLKREGLGLLPYFPLASGMLTGKYKRGQPGPKGARLSAPGLSGRYMNDKNWAIVEKLEAFCAARGKTILELAFAWLLAHDYVPSVIAGATSAEQVEQNARCARWKLTAAEKEEVDRIAK